MFEMGQSLHFPRHENPRPCPAPPLTLTLTP